MLHGELPFKGNTQDEKIKAIIENKLKVDPKITANGILFIHSLLSETQSFRPSIGQVFLNKWVSKSIKQSKNMGGNFPEKLTRLDASVVSV